MQLFDHMSILIYSGILMLLLAHIIVPGSESIKSHRNDKGQEKFCKNLETLDKQGIKPASNHFLKNIDSSKNRNINFDSIKTWLLRHDCIREVSISNRLIETEPPRQEFIIQMKDSTLALISFWISAGQQYEFYDLKNTINQ